MKKVLLVADVSNLYYCIKGKFDGRRLDYSKFLHLARGNAEIHRAIAYGSELNEQATDFKVMLKSLGFETKYKEPKIYFNKRKANWDIGMVIDVIQIMDSVDIVVFGTADGDFAPAVEYVKSRGKIARVIASGISPDLKSVSDQWIEINNDMLERAKDESDKTVGSNGPIEGSSDLRDL